MKGKIILHWMKGKIFLPQSESENISHQMKGKIFLQQSESENISQESERENISSAKWRGK